MKKRMLTMIMASTLLLTMSASGAENSPEEPSAAKISKDDFLPDWDFSGKVFQVTANPIIWSDDRSLAVVWVEDGANCMVYSFWCLKRTAQGTMAPIAKYMIWTDFSKKAILLEEHGLTVVLDGSNGGLGTTEIRQYFPFELPQAKVSFLRLGQEHLRGIGHEDLDKEWKHFLEQ